MSVRSMGACFNRSASGVAMVAGGPGAFRRARMFKITLEEWTP